jgi:hypothetical protein
MKKEARLLKGISHSYGEQLTVAATPQVNPLKMRVLSFIPPLWRAMVCGMGSFPSAPAKLFTFFLHIALSIQRTARQDKECQRVCCPQCPKSLFQNVLSFLVVLEFELRALNLVSRHSTT